MHVYFEKNIYELQFCYRYMFYGVVAYGMGHYISYIRRSDGTWETHNDLQKKIKRFSSTGDKKANPHCLVYNKF